MTSFRTGAGYCVIACAVLSLFAAMVFAQTVTGTISGTVRDSSGLALPAAQVEVLNQDTGLARTVESDAAGRYSALLLPLGSYKVTAKLQGFQAEARDGIVLTVGREAVVDLTMSVGAITQTVEVHGEAALINTTSSTIQGLVSGEQIRELPLNGRSYNDLALLNPGVSYNANKGSSASDGFGVRMSVNGARANNNLFLIDGTVTNDTSQTAGTVNADSMGVEGIREFTVLTHNYAAEFGHSAGGVVNAVTRSGTNQLHGSLYEFLRNSDLDARNFFDQASQPIPSFKRNQFGAVVGGPIHKDQTFFFGSFESLIDRLGVTGVTSVPNANARKGLLPTGQINVNQAIQPFLDTLLPPPNGRDLGGGVAQYLFTEPQPTNEYFTQGRIDHRFSASDSLFVRYTFDN